MDWWCFYDLYIVVYIIILFFFMYWYCGFCWGCFCFYNWLLIGSSVKMFVIMLCSSFVCGLM